MSVFSQLCLRARRLGAQRLIFTADLFEVETEEGICGAWTCIGGSLHGEDAVGLAHGRTGEEALRALVDKLERGERE
jgi:hypothetical protein